MYGQTEVKKPTLQHAAATHCNVPRHTAAHICIGRQSRRN